MAAWRYKISLLVLKNISLATEKRNFVPPSGHAMFYLLYKHQRFLYIIFVI